MPKVRLSFRRGENSRPQVRRAILSDERSDKMHPTADPIPPRNFVSAMAFIITGVAMIVSALALKKRLASSGVPVYAQVTHTWNPDSTKPWGLANTAIGSLQSGPTLR